MIRMSVFVSVCLSVCLSVREDISRTTRAVITNFSGRVAYGRGSVVLRQGDEIPRGRGNFGGLSGPFKGIGNLRCSRRCLVRCKRDHSIGNNVMQQKGSFSMQASANRNPEISERRRCSLSAGKGMMGVQIEGEV